MQKINYKKTINFSLIFLFFWFFNPVFFNFSSLYTSLKILNFSDFTKLFFVSSLDYYIAFGIFWGFILIVNAILLAFVFYHLNFKNLFSSGFSVFFSLIFSHCIACGGFIAYFLVSFLGLNGLFLALPWGGKELILVSLTINIWLAYNIYKKLKKPGIC